jgi:DNA topoisomerase-1
MNLLLVESPAKSRTLKKFLGKDYQIAATLGHIRDLPKKKIGIDIENNFKPTYVTIPSKRSVITNLKKQSKKAKQIILAMDPDREGEAIAWHTAKALSLGKNYQRIVFHEITEQAVKDALKNPRKIDQDLFNAQQARRILDRIVGYKLSPLLWRKVTKGLSAGRVQSVALRLIVDREKEIKQFVPQEYWTVEALLKKKEDGEFVATLVKKGTKSIPRLGIKNKKQADKILKDLKGAEYKVKNIEKKETKRMPPEPFITSTLQQESWKRFRWPAQRTMRIAQQLYEQGYITYHRSDSLNLSQQALKQAEQIIVKEYGKEYWPGSPRKFKTKSKVAQEAHEAIRPSYPNRFPDQTKENLNQEQAKLYDLVWRRFIACQMSPALLDSTTIDVEANKYIFRATGQILKFDGFLRVYPISFEQAELPDVKKNELLELKKLVSSQHFTKPPARYTEATLIKELEKNAIGRPSTYAPIISVIQKRNYVKKNEQKRFYPTEIGTMVSDLLVEHFPQIVDIKFTAKMEEDLDKIAEGKKEWVALLKEFYQPFEQNLKKKYKEIEKKVEKTEKTCPKCNSPLVIRMGRFGKFYGCSNFPKCKFTQPMEGGLGIQCPKCKKGEIVEKRTKKKKVFYGCNRWPDCDFALWDKPLDEKCPECGSFLVRKENGEIRCFNEDCKLG